MFNPRTGTKPAPYPIIQRSGFDVTFPSRLPVLKSEKFRILDATVAGDAPKDFLRIYQHELARRDNPSRWPAWIAKVGHKYYPNESITEHLLTRIGQSMGLNVADSQLMWFGGQLRFLSRYFLRRRGESLVHGAEIFAGYLSDRDFVEEVEARDEARNLFTFQFVEDALRNRFSDHSERLIGDFTRLLAFDAIVGNNDRHFYNWGVIDDVSGSRAPRFSPIFDTARALYWNTTEARLAEIAGDKNRRRSHQAKYVERCFPKTGWDGLPTPNHFGLIRAISAGNPELSEHLRCLPVRGLVRAVRELLEGEFADLISPLRADFILECLELRVNLYEQAVNTTV